ncbi:hypothetical protein NMG60_11016487 [Bertholletia excelsa]
MAIRGKRSSTLSMRSLCLLLGVTTLLITTQVSIVDCRTLRAESLIGTTEQVDGATSKSESTDSFSFSSSDSTRIRYAVMSLVFKLASGPSRKGPGH